MDEFSLIVLQCHTEWVYGKGVIMLESTMTVRLDEKEKSLISDYARMFGMSASQFVRRCALERIEDEIDIEAYKAAKAEYDANPTSYSLSEVKEMLGL